jgi:cytochrome c556
LDRRFRRGSEAFLKLAVEKVEMRVAVVLVAGSVLACASYGGLMAARPEPAAVQQLVDARVAHYKEIGKANKAIRDELGQSQPNLAAVQANARVIEALARQIPTWFPRGSGQQAGVKSEALPAIWEQLPTFKQRSVALVSAAHQAAAAAATGDLDATKTAVGAIGNACKACHDTFREKK